jgi:hypothetical protein
MRDSVAVAQCTCNQAAAEHEYMRGALNAAPFSEYTTPLVFAESDDMDSLISERKT